jgi:hypothetical protein
MAVGWAPTAFNAIQALDLGYLTMDRIATARDTMAGMATMRTTRTGPTIDIAPTTATTIGTTTVPNTTGVELQSSTHSDRLVHRHP